MRVKGGKTNEQLANDVYNGLTELDELPGGVRDTVAGLVNERKAADEKAAKAAAKAKKKKGKK